MYICDSLNYAGQGKYLRLQPWGDADNWDSPHVPVADCLPNSYKLQALHM